MWPFSFVKRFMKINETGEIQHNPSYINEEPSEGDEIVSENDSDKNSDKDEEDSETEDSPAERPPKEDSSTEKSPTEDSPALQYADLCEKFFGSIRRNGTHIGPFNLTLVFVIILTIVILVYKYNKEKLHLKADFIPDVKAGNTYDQEQNFEAIIQECLQSLDMSRLPDKLPIEKKLLCNVFNLDCNTLKNKGIIVDCRCLADSRFGDSIFLSLCKSSSLYRK